MSHGRPRVGHVLHSMVLAGAETLVYEIITRLSREFDFSLFLLDEIGPLGEELRSRGIPVRMLSRSPGVDLGLTRRLARGLREEKVSLLHAHQYTPWFYGSLGAIQGWRRPRILFTEHGRHYPDHPRPKRMLFNQFLEPFADGVVAVSEFIRDCLRDNEGFPEPRIRVLYNGIDPARFEREPSREALRREQGVGPDDPTVGIAARLAPVKDHRTLLHAFRVVVGRMPRAKLVLAGEGPLRGELEKETRALGLADSVRFLGLRRDVPALLKTWNAFCLSSLSEGTSVTLLEAMSSGLPAVVTAVGGNPEIVENGETGLLVPRQDPEALGHALLETLANPEESRRRGAAGRERVRRLFTLERMIDEYRDLYRELLDGGRT